MKLQSANKQRSLFPHFILLSIVLIAMKGLTFGEDIAVVYRKQLPDLEKELIQQSAGFYGLSVRTIDLDSPGGPVAVLQELKSPTLRAVLISYDALPLLRAQDILRNVKVGRKNRVPVLIFGVSAGHDAELFSWSRGRINGCTPLPSDYFPSQVLVGRVETLTGILSGADLDIVTVPDCALKQEPLSDGQNVLTAEQKGGVNAAILARTLAQGTEVFFVPKVKVRDLSWVAQPLGTSKAFSYLAPFLLFVRYAAGEYGWHSERPYANLTIDDPWLVEPYGHLNYKLLLTEMEKHNFHTTIAFIPWNFDRSRPNVVSLFRSHPDRFSICIHGDDHSHNEFKGTEGGTIEEQSAKLKQAIARMERFRALTGISYDRFMVFPHNVATERTFVALKRYGYLGTANSVQVPAGSPFPRNPSFLLRPYTTEYGDFLSMFRYSAEVAVPRQDILVQVFLGNPVLFYGHQQLFDDGMASFNEVADFVNGMRPDTKWASLGEIARHAYLVRKRNDGAFDVRMLANEITLTNLGAQGELEFYIERPEHSSPKEVTVEIDGKPVEFALDHNTVRLHTEIGTGEKKEVRIRYSNDFVLANEDLGNSGIRVWSLRKVSDFRDMTLSRFSWGRRLASAYYRNGWNRTEERWEGRANALLITIALGFGAFLIYRWKSSSIRKHRSGA